MSSSQAPSPAAAFGTIAHTEFTSQDPEATRAFLEKVFGWRFQSQALPQGEYHFYETPGGGRGGVRGLGPQESPAAVSYVEVEDLEQARKDVEQAGGTLVLPRVDVPGMGAFFWFRVPGGPVLACWQSLPQEQ